MKIVKLFILIGLMILLLSSCTLTGTDESVPKTPNDEFEEFKLEVRNEMKNINSQIDLITRRINRLENDISNLDDRVSRLRTTNLSGPNTTEELSVIIDSLNRRIRNLEGFLFEDYENNYETYDFETINSRLLFLEDSYSSLKRDLDFFEKELSYKNNGTENVSDRIYDRVYNIEKKQNEIMNLFNELEKRLIEAEKYKSNNNVDEELKNIYSNLNSINERINEIEKIYEESDFYFLQNGNLLELVEKQFEKIDFERQVNNIIEYQVEQVSSKFYYKSQGENIYKINDLETQVKEMNKKLETLSINLESVLTIPNNNINERYLSMINDLERKLNTAMLSLGDAYFKDLFDNRNEIIYEVKSGDTLSGISVAYDLGRNGVEILMSANNLTNANALRIGQKLTIPVGNLEKYIQWPFSTTRPINYERFVLKFGDRIGGGISSGLGVLPIKDEILRPILPGKVIETGKNNNNQWYIKIDHGNSIISVSSGICTIYVNQGSWVSNSTDLGIIRKDDLVMIELWKAGEPRDPLKLFFQISGDFVATYYTEWDDKLVYDPTFRLTRSGSKPETWRTIAADPNVLPLGTIVYIPELSHHPNKGFFVVEDTGGKIIGDKIDIYVNDIRLAKLKETVSVYIVGAI